MTDDLQLWPGEVERLESDLKEAKTKERRQLAWWVIGTTPAAVIPTAGSPGRLEPNRPSMEPSPPPTEPPKDD